MGADGTISASEPLDQQPAMVCYTCRKPIPTGRPPSETHPDCITTEVLRVDVEMPVRYRGR